MKTIKKKDLIGRIELDDRSGYTVKIEYARGFGDYVVYETDGWPFDDEGNEIEAEWTKGILTKSEVEKIFKAKIIDEEEEEI